MISLVLFTDPSSVWVSETADRSFTRRVSPVWGETLNCHAIAAMQAAAILVLT